MENEDLDEIKVKKEKLEAELERIQKELDENIDEVRSDVSHKLKPSEIIKNYPLPVVGLSVLVGFLAGHKSRRKPSGRESGNSGSGFTSLLMSELKKFATRKAVNLATDYIDEIVESKKRELTGQSDEADEQ
ncbi:MAG: hypothetical protein R3281_07980 [Balneolaceae bacterium]|nr:hypothetical protein [Balneolaceae bacterium]